MNQLDEDTQRPQARAARATMLFLLRESVTRDELMQVTGIRSRQGVDKLIDNLSLGHVPIYEIELGHWALNRDEIGQIFE